MHCCAMTAVFQSEAMDLPGDVAGSASGRPLNISKCSSCTTAQWRLSSRAKRWICPEMLQVAHQEKQLNMNICSLLYCCATTAVFQSEAMDLPGDVAGSASGRPLNISKCSSCTAAKWRLSSRAKRWICPEMLQIAHREDSSTSANVHHALLQNGSCLPERSDESAGRCCS